LKRGLLIAAVVVAQSAWAQAPLPLTAPNDDLQTAIVKRDAARLAAFARAGRSFDVNFNDGHEGRTQESPLTMAVNRNFPDIARLLLEAGASPNRRDASGRAPIHQARSAEMARLLVQAGADPNALTPNGQTAIALAVERGDLQAVDALLSVGARLDTPLQGTDLLTLALDRRQPQMVRPLLERGLDPRAVPSQAIWRLIESGDEDTAILLVQRGTDPNARGASYGEPLLVRALFRKRYLVAQALVDAGAQVKLVDPPDCAGTGFGCFSTQIARMASFNSPLLGKLVARGLDLDTVDALGHTALSALLTEQTFTVRAAGSTDSSRDILPPDNVARVKALLEQGANPNVKYRDATPLMLAIADPGKRAFVDVLVEHGGRIEFERVILGPGELLTVLRPGDPTAATGIPIGNQQGVFTGMRIGPLTWAVMHGRADVALRMLARGDKVGAADRHLLYFTAALGQAEAVPGMLRSTREVNVSDRAGVTPLMLAADAGDAAAVRALLAAGARVNARSDREWPPLLERGLHHYIGGHSPSRPRLVGGYTALRAARERGHAEVARLLSEAGGRD
jgi:ankyrin repeat protein